MRASVLLLDAESGARTPWRELAPADRTGVVCSRCVLLTPDGESCAYMFVARGLS